MINKVKKLQKYLGMYVSQRTYTHVVAYLDGMNHAYENEFLKGFREWLIIRFNTGNNLCWDSIILQGLFEEGKIPNLNIEPQDNIFLINTLFDLLNTFLAERESLGLQSIEARYEKWLAEQEWYQSY